MQVLLFPRDLRFDNVPFKVRLLLLQIDCLAGMLFLRKSLNLCVLCVFVVRSTCSPAELYLRIHFTRWELELDRAALIPDF